MTADIVMAIDPGREKCGIAVVDQQQGVLVRQVIHREFLPETVRAWAETYHTTFVVLGNRTSSKETLKLLQGMQTAAGTVTVTPVDEHRSSEEARLRYWRENPPRGLWRLMPTSFRTPPVPIDDWVAVILAERYFAGK
ncbi:MAG: hypothetical protein H6Q65_1390 [Firmicutes bacterium]|nr:hypothetical protein [Bacillota bacterium]